MAKLPRRWFSRLGEQPPIIDYNTNVRGLFRSLTASGKSRSAMPRRWNRFRKKALKPPRGTATELRVELSRLAGEQAKIAPRYDAAVLQSVRAEIARFVELTASESTVINVSFRHQQLEPASLYEDATFAYWDAKFPAEVGHHLAQMMQRRIELQRQAATSRLLGPLTRRRVRSLQHQSDEFAEHETRLRTFVAEQELFRNLLHRCRALEIARRELEDIQREISDYSRALNAQLRKPESQIEKLRARAQTQENEVRSHASRLRSSMPRTAECPYCERPLPIADHLDHIIPVAMGGRNFSYNLVRVCVPCNSKKSDLTLFEFAERNRINYSGLVVRLRGLGKRV